MITEPELAVVSADPALPAASENPEQENVAAPAVSSPLIVSAAPQSVPEPLIVAASPSIVQVRPVTASDASMSSEIVSPDFAYPLLPLVDIAMVSVGAVKSKVTAPLSAVVSASPVFPAASV